MPPRTPPRERKADSLGDNLTRRVPPHDTAAEQSVLGSVFVRPGLIEQLGETLHVGDFYSPIHRDIFTACLELSRRRHPVDLLTVASELERMGRLADVGGQVYLGELASSTVVTANAIHHAKVIREKARRRGMLRIAAELVDSAFDPTAEPEGFAARARQVVDDVLDDRLDSWGEPLVDLMPGYLDYLARLQDGAAWYIPTPFRKLNELIVGWCPGEMTVVAARPSNGKSAFAVNSLLTAAHAGYPCGIASLEMQKYLLVSRMFSDKGEVDAQRFRNGRFEDADWAQIYQFADAVYSQKLPIIIDDKPKRRPSELRALFRRWKRDHGLRLAVVDYLQFVAPETRGAKREQEIAEISRELKAIAKELDIALMVLCQLSRKAEEDKKFLLSHLRESGSIEQDADIVLGINPWKSNDDVVPVTLVVGKSRNSRVGSVDIVYRRKFSRFEEA